MVKNMGPTAEDYRNGFISGSISGAFASIGIAGFVLSGGGLAMFGGLIASGIIVGGACGIIVVTFTSGSGSGGDGGSSSNDGGVGGGEEGSFNGGESGEFGGGDSGGGDSMETTAYDQGDDGLRSGEPSGPTYTDDQGPDIIENDDRDDPPDEPIL